MHRNFPLKVSQSSWSGANCDNNQTMLQDGLCLFVYFVQMYFISFLYLKYSFYPPLYTCK